MYKLHYFPGHASLSPHLILAELNVDFELALVDLDSDRQKSAEYLTLNPARRIPVLAIGSNVIFECDAICLYLCEQHTHAKLLHAVGTHQRALCLRRLICLANILQA